MVMADKVDVTASVPGQSPGISGVAVLSATKVRVTFDRAAVDNAALRNADNYQITPVLSVSAVVPETVANPTYVDLTIDEQTTGVSYTVALLRIEAA